jgi:hypothetical protein
MIVPTLQPLTHGRAWRSANACKFVPHLPNYRSVLDDHLDIRLVGTQCDRSHLVPVTRNLCNNNTARDVGWLRGKLGSESYLFTATSMVRCCL